MADQYTGSGSQYPAGSFYENLANRITALEAILGTAPGAVPDGAISKLKLSTALQAYIDTPIRDQRNKIINGDFEIIQRLPNATTGSWVSPVLNYYTFDRWVAQSNGTGGAGSLSRVAVQAGQTSIPGNPTYCLNWTITAAAAGQTVGGCFLEQRMENVRLLSGRKATITLYVQGTGTLPSINLVQVFGSGGSTLVVTQLAANVVLGAAFTKCQYVVDVPSVLGKTIGPNSYLALNINVPVNTTYSLQLAHVSVVEGDASSEDDAFSARHPALEELLCQRYFQWCPMNIIWMAPASGVQHTYSSSLKTSMRATPSVGAIQGDPNGTPSNVNNANQSVGFLSKDSITQQVVSSAGGYVQVSGYRFPLDAEL